jgi:hypothetical protein
VAAGVLPNVHLAACSGPDDHTATVLDSPGAAVHVAAVPRSDVERDLSLDMVHGNAPVEIGHDADIKVQLTNRSAARSYAVVLSSDGSDEPGWREPHVWYSVERKTVSGTWRPAAYQAKRICGNFDENWEKDIVELGPGKSVELPWFEFRPGMWNLDDTTSIRVVAHYSYGEHVKDLRKVSPALHRMPAYVLASAPLELPLDTPLGLELRVLAPIPRAPGVPLAQVFDVVAVNNWSGPLPFSTLDAGGSRLSFQIEYEETPGRPEKAYFSAEPGDSHAARDLIGRGERRAVVTASTRTDEELELSPGTRLRRVRAVLSVYEYSGERSVFSPWVNVAAP